LELIDSVRLQDDNNKEIVRSAVRKEIHWHRNYGEQEGLDEFLEPFEAAYQQLQPSDLIARHAWLFKQEPIDLPFRHRDEGYEGRQSVAWKLRKEALAEIFALDGWHGITRLAELSNGGWQIGWIALEAGVPLPDAVAWISKEAGSLERGVQLTSLAAGILNSSIQQNGQDALHQVLIAADEHGCGLDWKIRLLTLAPENRATWDVVATIGSEAKDAYWRSCNGNIWERDNVPDRQFALTQLV
jgi:hypothetical protein